MYFSLPPHILNWNYTNLRKNKQTDLSFKDQMTPQK